MKSATDRTMHHEAIQRALALGRAADPHALPELAGLLRMPSAEIRRLAASAIGKLAGFGADPDAAVAALAPIALHDPHPEKYWGMDTLDYQIGMLVKKQMYQHAGKRLVSIYPKDLPQLDALLAQKLALLGRSESALDERSGVI